MDAATSARYLASPFATRRDDEFGPTAASHRSHEVRLQLGIRPTPTGCGPGRVKAASEVAKTPRALLDAPV